MAAIRNIFTAINISGFVKAYKNPTDISGSIFSKSLRCPRRTRSTSASSNFTFNFFDGKSSGFANVYIYYIYIIY